MAAAFADALAGYQTLAFGEMFAAARAYSVNRLILINAIPKLLAIISARRGNAVSIHHDNSRDGACAKPFSPLGLVIIGIIVFISIVLWQHGPSVGTLVLLPLLLMCPLIHFLMHRQTHGSYLGS